VEQSETPCFVQVAIPVPLRQLFTYIVPSELITSPINIGERVVVSFRNRQVVGVVLSVAGYTEQPVEKLKSITSRVIDNFHFDANLLQFLQRCSDYYHHPIGDILQQALPVLLRQIKQPDVSLPIVWQASQKIDNAVLEKLKTKAAKQYALFQLIKNHLSITWAELRTLGYLKTQLTALDNKGLIEPHERQPTLFKWTSSALNTENKLTLSTEQAVVLSAIEQTNTQFSCHLIDGITGSGKTEVYLQAMENILSANKQVLVLVPEIGLTPQTLNRFEQRFNVPICLHHSGLNNNERLQTWLEAQRGSAAIVIGTRSAIFTPLHQLGMIIIDEEHDGSFKQQDTFRYNARDMAILRARQLNIPIILGSATPSLESLHNATSGKFHYHQLLNRAGNSSTSQIQLINIAQHQMENGLSDTLKSEIKKTIARGEQVLVFLNRRGYAPAINCQECHWIADCTRCNKPYTLHQSKQLLICHHCGNQRRVPAQCDSCGSIRIKPLGQGTEQLEQRISELFPDASCVRIDRDSTRKKGELAKLLQEVTEKKHQILLGTQMLAKGHHFPDVTLVAMLDIDGALFSFDFRASEHMAQLLVQVAGRAGRESKPGKVLVQTAYPEHPLLQDLVNNGYKHFADYALTERKQAYLPPYGFQALFRAEANYPSYPDKFLREICAIRYDGCELAGPLPAAMEKRGGKYRFHLIVQSKTRKQLHTAIHQMLHLIPNNEWQSKVRWSLDVDPTELSW